MTELRAGDDFRVPELRRETFLRFFTFHVEHRAHPGAVYYLMPELRRRLGWGPEEALWFAFINGLTQHPVTSLLVVRRFPEPSAWEELGWWWQDNLARLRIDTDRRHHKGAVPLAAARYAAEVGRSQQLWWEARAEGGWPELWSAARGLYSFGRLSAWSYLEYVRIMGGHELDADTLLLEDVDGSRSHRNGLALVAGRDDLDRYKGPYSPEDLALVTELGEDLLDEARARSSSPDVCRLTLESALCTYKSWHRPNRRYPNVYNDMLHDRIRDVERLWPDEDLGIFWAIRRDALPEYLRLEDMPHDPGVTPLKQNWYRETGCPPMMHRVWPCFANDLNRWIEAGELPPRRRAA